MLRGAHASRVFGERVLAIANFRCALFTVQEKRHLKQRLFWRNAKTSTRDACAPQNRIARWAACHAVALCEGGFGVGRWMFSASLRLAMHYTLYRSRFLWRCALIRLRRLCLAIFAFRLFLREPIQISRLHKSRFNHLTRSIATAFPRGIATDVTRIAFQHRARKQSNR